MNLFPNNFTYKDSDHHFYMLGSMGLSSSIGLGLSMEIDNTVISIDGDGSVEVAGADAAAKLAECLKTPGPHVIVAKVDPGSQAMNPIPLTSIAIRDRFREAVKQAKAKG